MKDFLVFALIAALVITFILGASIEGVTIGAAVTLRVVGVFCAAVLVARIVRGEL